MKIYMPYATRQQIGGGMTFYKNLKKGASDLIFVDNWRDCDFILITGATMTNRDEMKEAKAGGKKIVFRIDNLPKDSRNRGTAFSRVKDFAQMADWIIFQSEWAKDYVGWWLVDNSIDINSKSSIIHNGVDTEFFYKNDKEKNDKRYLFVQFNRDENKREREAFYDFHQAFRKDKDVELWIVGRFSPELVNYNFDFFGGESVKYLNVIEDRLQLGDTMRSCKYFLFPAYADAAPNTLMEAMACGCEPVGVNPVGGSIEIKTLMDKGVRTIQDMAEDYKSVFSKLI